MAQKTRARSDLFRNSRQTLSVSLRCGVQLHLLFVYGSLRRGRANHHQLGSAAYVSLARTAPCFALVVIDGYPALVPGSRAIEGELFRIDPSALRALDEFEGPAYVRREIELQFGQRALAYLSSVPGAGEAYAGDRWDPVED